MSKKDPVCPAHDSNIKRSEAKSKRKKGVLAIKKEKMDVMAWGQKHDPLFKVKGKERHRRLHATT